MTAHDPHDETVDMLTEEHAQPTVAQSSDPARGWQWDIPSVASLTCGLLGLLMFLDMRAGDPEPVPAETALFLSLALTVLGVLAILLGIVGFFVSRGTWLRIVALVGFLAGIVPSGVGFIITLFVLAMKDIR